VVKKVCIFFFLLSFYIFFPQSFCTLSGKVTEKSTGQPLPGVVVSIPAFSLHTQTDANGRYSLKNIPPGRHTVKFFLSFYEPETIPGFLFNSGKDNVLDIELTESVHTVKDVEVRANADSSLIAVQLENPGVRLFRIEETERYAAGRQDPARMVQNFAGVQSSNDARNDIIVRGNSPAGVLWRWEDVDVFNPNHFAIAGSAGGPQSIINNRYLANSEFFTGAFPASYGNALGAVFDLKMRNGNPERHEMSFQLGVLGTEALAEGPLHKKSGASYLVTYRYSTLKLFSSINFSLGTSAIPDYQDAGFKIFLPAGKAGIFSFSGIGGISNINIILSTIHERPRELYGDQNRDQYFGSKMGTTTLSHWIGLGKNTTLKSGIAYGTQFIGSKHYQIIRKPDYKPKDTLPLILDYAFLEQKITLYSYIKHKFNSQQSCKTGFYIHRFSVNYRDKIKINALTDTIPTQIEQKPFKERMNAGGEFFIYQFYYQQHSRWNGRWTTQAGMHFLWYELSGEFVPEPRMNVLFQASSRHLLSLSGGIHSQMQPAYIHFAAPDSVIINHVQVPNLNKELSNKNLKVSRAAHLVFSHQWFVSERIRLQTDVYYQWIWNVPVYPTASGISLINRGTTFTRFFPSKTMVNRGTGYNYGIEFTFDKRFFRNYYILSNLTLFQSKYLASDNRWRNTDYNAQYYFNFLAGYERPFGKSRQNRWLLGIRYVHGGGRLYSPPDIPASNAVMEIVPVNDSINTLRFPDYSRLDFRTGIRFNAKKTSWEIMLDILNVLNTRNILSLTYSPDPSNLQANPVRENYQLGRLPLLYIRLDF